MYDFLKDVEETFKDRWIKEARDEGLKEGRRESIAVSIGNLMETLSCSAEKAMELLKISPEDRAMLGNSLPADGTAGEEGQQ